MTAHGHFGHSAAAHSDARNAIRHVFIRDLVLSCRIGVHRHEETRAQRVRINLDLAVAMIAIYETTSRTWFVTSVSRTPCGRWLRADISDCWKRLAEEMAAICLQDLRVRSVRGAGGKAGHLPGRDQRGCRNREVFQLMTRPEPLRGGLELPQGRYSFAQQGNRSRRETPYRGQNGRCLPAAFTLSGKSYFILKS